jgi:hypothetical protein
MARKKKKKEQAMNASDKKGFISEIKAYAILQQLKHEGWIVEFMPVSRIHDLDKKGVDYLVVVVKNGKRKFEKIDIKSSEVGVSRYNQARLLGKKEGKAIMISPTDIPYFIKTLYS